MLSVTSEAAPSASFPPTRQKPARDDASSPGDSFGALVDANAQASQAATPQTSNRSDQHDERPDRSPEASRPDRTTPPSSGRPAHTNSTAGPGTGIQEPATGVEASNDTHDHRAKHEGTKVASTKNASDATLVASDATPAAPTASPQPTTPVAVAVPVTIPVAATPSTTSAATAATGSVAESIQATGLMPAQAAGAQRATPAATGFTPAATADTMTVAAPIVQDAQVTQTNALQPGLDGEAGGALAAAIIAVPATAKATTKTPDNALPAKTTSSIMTGLQPGPTATDLTATSAASGSPAASHDAIAGDHKHDAVATDSAKAASPDASALAPQPAVATPQHSAQATDAAAPQPGQNDSGQQQGINSALAQPQVQSTTATTPATPQYNVAAAAGTAVPLNGLAVQIAVTAQSGKSRFEIRLDPADLGRIDVRLDVDREGRVTSHLTVDKPETLAMLRQDAPQLQRALQDAGLKTSDSGLQFSLRDQSSQGQTARDDTGRNAQRLIVTEDDIVPAAAAGRTYGRMLGSSGGLDIRV